MISTLIVALVLAKCSHAAVRVENGEITFDNRENGLPFPLPHPESVDMMLVHASHCVKALLEELEGIEHLIVQLHMAHCWDTVRKGSNYLDEHQYVVNKWVCDTFRPRFVIAFNSAGSITFEGWDAKYSVIAWGKEDPNQKPPRDQITAYFGSQVRNVAELQIKKMTNPEGLTRAEVEYLDKLESDRIIAQAAIAVYCGSGGNLDLVRRALEDRRPDPHLIH